MGRYNYVFTGKVIPIIAPHDVESGQGLIIESLFGIVGNTVKEGQSTELHLEEAWRLRKATVELKVGEKLYWDAEHGLVSNVAEDKPLIGVSIQNVAAQEPLVEVRLNGVALG